MQYKIVLVFTVLCVPARADPIGRNVMKETLPAYAVAANADILNSTKCREELEMFRDGVDHRILWSLNILDSSGDPGSGFMYGNNYWLGRRKHCVELADKETLQLAEYILQNNSQFRKPEEEYPPYRLNYFIAYFTHNSTIQYHVRLPNEHLITLGICLPSSCTTDEISVILKRIFDERTLLASRLYSADFMLVKVKDLKDDYQWLLSGKIILIIVIVAFMLVLTIAGTLYDVLVFEKRRNKKIVICENNNTADIKREPESNGTALSVQQSESRIGQFIMCFSVYTNTGKIFDTKLSPDSIPVVHGIKFFGMVWIVLIHTIFYAYPFADNRTEAYKMSNTFVTQVISNSTVSVDTFFFLSGYLLSYIYFIKNNKEEFKQAGFGKKIATYFILIFRRFIRITPAYMTVLGLVILNFTWYDKISIFDMTEEVHDACSKYWWRNLLYINNLFHRDEMCMSWSWYLSNDMQFFAFGTIVLMLSSAYFYTAIGLATLTLILSTALNAYIAYNYNYILTMDEQFKFLSIMYDPPWLRITPYIIGMGTALLLSKLDNKLHLGKKMLAVCWCLGIACNCSILFGLTNRQMSLTLSILYTALSRTGWGIGLAWLIVACRTNNAGMVSKFLSYPLWVPLSKLTFCAYLINPLLINSLYLYCENAVRVEFMSTGVTFLGILLTTYTCAYLLSLVLEVPYILMMRLYLNLNGNTT